MDIELNKKNAIAFYKMAYYGDPEKAIELYVGNEYIQHNPDVEDGKKGFIEYSGNGSEVREYINVLDAANLSFKILHEDYRNRAVTITGQQSIKVSDMFAMICDIIGKKIDIKYLNKNEHKHHYGSTPYRYTPKPSLKITPNEFVDLGQGLLDVIEENSSNFNFVLILNLMRTESFTKNDIFKQTRWSKSVFDEFIF